MIGLILWGMSLYFNAPHEAEMTERMTPPGWHGNYWGPEATKARKEGKLPPISYTPQMQRWDRWGRQVLRTGDIVFRLGDARLAHGYFPMSRFYANTSNSKFSHTAIVCLEDEAEGPVVYDTTRTSVARQPFAVWVLDNVGSIGVKRLRPEYRKAIPRIADFCHRMYEAQPPFDYELNLDDQALYCVEMTEKAFRSAGLPLSAPVRPGDIPRRGRHHLPFLVAELVGGHHGQDRTLELGLVGPDASDHRGVGHPDPRRGGDALEGPLEGQLLGSRPEPVLAQHVERGVDEERAELGPRAAGRRGRRRSGATVGGHGAGGPVAVGVPPGGRLHRPAPEDC